MIATHQPRGLEGAYGATLAAYRKASPAGTHKDHRAGPKREQGAIWPESAASFNIGKEPTFWTIRLMFKAESRPKK